MSDVAWFLNINYTAPSEYSDPAANAPYGTRPITASNIMRVEQLFSTNSSALLQFVFISFATSNQYFCPSILVIFILPNGPKSEANAYFYLYYLNALTKCKIFWHT